jgi:trk system potassium uptake protein TrkH
MNTKAALSIRNFFSIFGVLIMMVGGLILLPLVALPFYPQEVGWSVCFLLPAGIAILAGFLLKRLDPGQEIALSLKQDAVIVVGVWIVGTLFSSMPFVLSGMLDFSQAYFEAMSGWTTTGLSVVDVTAAPHVFLLFRSMMQFFGGLGFILLVVSALSETFGMRLYTAECHSDKLLPNLARSARMIFKIYIGYFIAGVVLYVWAGMPVFDAVNISMAALSTGGFAVTPDSIAAYNSFPIELISVVLMILGATNFLAHMLLIKRKFKTFFRIGETRFMFLLLGILIPLVAVVSLQSVYDNLGEAFRVSLFNITSALTTTGFSTVAYNNWPAFSWLILVAMMIIGGGIGSTAGGIKYGRIYLLLKMFFWNLKRKFLPERSINELSIYRPEGKVYVTNDFYADAANYFFLYLFVLFIGTGLLASLGYSFQDSLFEFTSALGTVGLSVGVTTPDMPPLALWTMTAGMLLGRLEMYVIFIAVIKVSKDIKKLAVSR